MSEWIPYFQKSSIAFFLCHKGELQVLHCPPNFVLPLQLDETIQQIRHTFKHTKRKETCQLMDFSFVDFQARGKMIYAIEQSEEVLLLLIFSFDMELSLNTQKLCNHFKLTKKECEIVELVIQGLSNSEVGHRLNSSSNTVRVHLQNIFQKVGVGSRLELYSRALAFFTPQGEG